jgi:hypothetical protein
VGGGGARLGGSGFLGRHGDGIGWLKELVERLMKTIDRLKMSFEVAESRGHEVVVGWALLGSDGKQDELTGERRRWAGAGQRTFYTAARAAAVHARSTHHKNNNKNTQHELISGLPLASSCLLIGSSLLLALSFFSFSFMFHLVRPFLPFSLAPSRRGHLSLSLSSHGHLPPIFPCADKASRRYYSLSKK